VTRPAHLTIRRITAALAAVLAVVCLAGASLAGPAPRPVETGISPVSNEPARELAGIGIDDHAGRDLPRDVALTDQDGKAVQLGDYLDGKRPVVLAMAYYECPMLCSLVLKGVLDAAKDIAWTVGYEYRIVVVSFDPRDNPERAAKKRKTYLDAYGRKIGDRGFDFLVGDERSVRRVADAVGFSYRWDEREQQYAHAAGAFVITPSGRISRTLYGMAFPDLRLSVLEASEGKIGGVVEKFLLFCYHYDPASRGYILATIRLMKAGGVLTLIALAFLFYRLFRGERRRPSGGDDAGSAQHPGGAASEPSATVGGGPPHPPVPGPA
jgi:protein SCO1/2